MAILLQLFASLYDGQEVFVWSECLLNLGTDFLVGNQRFPAEEVFVTYTSNITDDGPSLWSFCYTTGGLFDTV